jgi:cytochrome c oxidase accessory protein FixG
MDTRDVENKSSGAEAFRDSVATIDDEGKRKWIYPFKPNGRLYDYRKALTVLYLGLFFALPFIKVGGEPIFMFNVVERKFILFGMIFWPQDFFIFGLGMLIFILFIALFTVIYGRVFCGWACPQTVFMEMVFRRVEYWIEGDATYQKALDKSPWNSKKILRRGGKHLAFFLISFLIANTFLSYIIGADEVIKMATEPVAMHKGGLAGILIFTSVFFFVYSWFREQVCLIVCPYGRMQGVLLDKDSIVVAYDYVRGEPRHKFSKKEYERKGDCIDCALCVKVCPTGIDIRNGTQLECVNCTACIDACNHMMDSVGLPRNLIRYDSENGISQGKKLKFTTRMKAYSAVLLLLISVEVFLLVSRADVDVTVLRARGMLYQEQPNNEVSNLYTIKLVNKTRREIPLDLRVENYPATIKVIGKNFDVKKEQIAQGEFFVYLNKSVIKQRKTRLEIGIYENNKKIKTVNTNFMGPANTN